LNIFRKTVLFGLLFFVVLLSFFFSVSNPGLMTLDIGFALLEDIPISIAFLVCLTFGWFFGLICVGLMLLQMASDRRRLRRKLRLAETEISSLRSLPLQDAN